MKNKFNNINRWRRKIVQHFFSIVLWTGVLYVSILSEHCLWNLFSHRHTEAKLRQEIKTFQDSISLYERQIEALQGDASSLEQYAREKLLMKKKNEDVFIVQ